MFFTHHAFGCSLRLNLQHLFVSIGYLHILGTNTPPTLSCTKEIINHAWDSGLAKNNKKRNENSSKTKLANRDISYIFENTCSETKYQLFQKLKNRGYNLDEYVFVKTGKNKTNHGLGYVKKIK